jgi:hypothetical protein
MLNHHRLYISDRGIMLHGKRFGGGKITGLVFSETMEDGLFNSFP